MVKSDSRFVSAALVTIALVLIFLDQAALAVAVPEGPSIINLTSNVTRGAQGAYMVNISGGYIATLNITAAPKNPRWKAFVGEVFGRFSLQDAIGSTIYDWGITTTTGKIYATRNASTVQWSQIKCANITVLTNESILMNHTNPDDNLTRTFNNSNHPPFTVGSIPFLTDQCPSLNTYVNNASQTTSFYEVALFDGTSDATHGTVVYSTILEQNTVGFNGVAYDFQMIVPENGAATFTGSTAYYLYVELN